MIYRWNHWALEYLQLFLWLKKQVSFLITYNFKCSTFWRFIKIKAGDINTYLLDKSNRFIDKLQIIQQVSVEHKWFQFDIFLLWKYFFKLSQVISNNTNNSSKIEKKLVIIKKSHKSLQKPIPLNIC